MVSTSSLSLRGPPHHSVGIDERAGIYLCSNDRDFVVPEGVGERLVVNSDTAFEFENDLFVGRIVILHREPLHSNSPTDRFHDYFATRKRRWELRWQGKFKRQLTSPVLFGADILRLHAPVMNFASRAFFSLLVKFAQSLARNRGSDLYTNSTTIDANASKFFRFPIHNCDLIFASPPGVSVPDTTLPVDMNDIAGSSSTVCNSLFKTSEPGLIDISQTYTFVFYSMYLDFVTWDVHNVPIGLSGMSINRLSGPQPVNVQMTNSDGDVYFRLVVANRNTSPTWASFLARDLVSEFFYSAASEDDPVWDPREPPRGPDPRSSWWIWRTTKRMLGLPSRYLGSCLRAPVSFVMRRGTAPPRRRIVTRQVLRHTSSPLADTLTSTQIKL